MGEQYGILKVAFKLPSHPPNGPTPSVARFLMLVVWLKEREEEKKEEEQEEECCCLCGPAATTVTNIYQSQYWWCENAFCILASARAIYIVISVINSVFYN